MFIVILLFLAFPSKKASCQLANKFNDYEISVTLNVPLIGSLELPAIMRGQVIYLPVKEIFDFIRIRNIPSSNFDSISGFFIHPLSKYLIDKISNRIEYNDEVFELKPDDLILTENNLYLKSDYFREVFELDCQFSFRSLSITLNTKIELPAIRDMRQELMRENIGRLKGEKKADTTIKRSYPLFKLGTADWAITATEQTDGRSNAKFNLDLGAAVAGGEANINLNYNASHPFYKRNQYYNWRFVNNNNAALRQVTAGKIFVQSTSSIYAPVTGVQFTNTPTTTRKSFGTYRLSSTTEPGWLVELYVNNVLVNYMKADASGFFSFEVPMVYGSSVIKFRAYGPWGEERFKEQYVNIPFNFLPLHQFEYAVTAGIVSDDEHSRYARANFNYGLGSPVTIGGGVEYLSSVASGKSMPFINAAVRLGPALLLTSEHTYGVRTKGVLTYQLPSNLQFELNYTKYEKLQTAVKFNYLEERKLMVSKPFHANKYTIFSRLTINQFCLPHAKNLTSEFLLSGSISGISSNLTTTAFINNNYHPNIFSNLSLSFNLPQGLRFSPQAQYNFSQKNFTMLKAEMQKQIVNHGLINVSYQKDNFSKSSIYGIGIRCNFSFTQASISATHSRHLITTTLSANGNFMYDAKTNYIGAKSQPGVGKGGIIISPFLDVNCNGKRDANEQKVSGLNVHLNGGRIERNNRDTTLHVTGLEAYNNYFIELNKNSFENIAWQIKKPVVQVTIEPNYLKLIEVPVAVVGEVSGIVFLNTTDEEKGIGRIIINIYDSTSTLSGKTLSESDGYFSFTGLAPGTYTAHIDTAQLHNLKMTSSGVLSFKILPNIDGDVVDGLKFVVVGSVPPTGKVDTVAVKKESAISERNTSSSKKLPQPTGTSGHDFLRTTNGILKTNKNNVFKKEDDRILSKDSLLPKEDFIIYRPVSSASRHSMIKKIYQQDKDLKRVNASVNKYRKQTDKQSATSKAEKEHNKLNKPLAEGKTMFIDMLKAAKAVSKKMKEKLQASMSTDNNARVSKIYILRSSSANSKKSLLNPFK